MTYRLTIFLFILGSLLPGCHSLNTSKANPAAVLTQSQQQFNTEQTQRRQALDQWSFTGKLAMTLPENKRYTGFIDWQQYSLKQYHINLQGPLNSGQIQIIGHTDPLLHHPQVTLMTPQQHITANSANSLLLQETGLQLPVESLYWWLRGLADPTTTYTVEDYDETGLISRFKQDHWVIQYLQFLTIDSPSLQAPIYLPKKIVMKQVENSFQLKWVVKSWNL